MNNTTIKKHARSLILFSIVLMCAGILFQYLVPQYASTTTPYIVLFFFIITLFTLFIVLRNPNQPSGKKFIVSYMLSRIIKMFSTLIFFILHILISENDRWQFAGAFIAIYFLFSIFEIFALNKTQ